MAYNVLDLREIVELSHHFGRGREWAVGGGGNTSVKDADQIAIKASGYSLGEITERGFALLERAAVRRILSKDYSADPMRREAEVKADLMGSRLHPETGARPSVETSLHEMLDRRFVVHLHPYAVNALLCSTDSERLVKELFGDKALYLPYADPGYTLARDTATAVAAYKRAHGEDPKLILMANHGTVVAADTAEEVKAVYEDLLGRIRARFASPLPGEALPVPDTAVRVVPAVRMILSEGSAAKIAAVRNNALIRHFLQADLRAKAALPFVPDHIVYCKASPLFLDFDGDAEKTLAALPGRLSAYKVEHGQPPKIALIEGIGLVAVEDTRKAAETALDAFEDLLRIGFLSENFGGPRFLTPSQIAFIDNWEVENYRRGIGKAAGAHGRLEGRIAVVTGAAQGFGRGIAEGLFREGAHVVIADLNVQAGKALEEDLNREKRPNTAMFCTCDVTDSASLGRMVGDCVTAFGGMDLMVSNAGVLRAGGLDELSEDSFDFITRVNYKGYFLCAKHASTVMRLQHRFRPDWTMDIVQINSKSGLEGSNRNFAYAGSKFGGVGLTQSFALELVDACIKVNSICPGNYFEGPLWMDPKNGLFVQYLHAGKVPGAKTVEDVKRHYEAKVPMKRGCRVPDVVRAILYLVEQEYETGQALPVTGGQVMMR